MSRAWFALICLMFCLSMAACYGPAPKIELSGSFKVEFAEQPTGGLGTPDKPRAVADNPETFYLKITALDAEGKVDTSYNGLVCMYVSKGLLVGGVFGYEVKNGVLERAQVRVRLAFGKTSLWVSEAKGMDKCKNATDPDDKLLPHVGRSGSAPHLYYDLLSISELQKATQSPYRSALFKQYAEIGRGKMVVTGVTSNGFYMTDLEAYNKSKESYHSLFVFTFSAPSLSFEEGAAPRLVQVGDLIDHVKGGVDEFSGQTQLTFPSFEPVWVDGVKDSDVVSLSESEMPKPIELTPDFIWSRASMEKFEAALVEVKDALPIPVLTEQEGWLQYRQWPLLIVRSNNEADKQKCIDFVRTELRVHPDPSKNNGGVFRACMDKCAQARQAADAKCPADEGEARTACIDKNRDEWFSCFYTGDNACRGRRNDGLFKRIEDMGCSHAIVMVISSATVPAYDPTSPEHLKNTFSLVRGNLQEVRATAFSAISEGHYPDEISNNGYVIIVRNPADLVVKQ